MPILHLKCSVHSTVLESIVTPFKSTSKVELEMSGLWLTNYIYTPVDFRMSWNLISISLMELRPESDQVRNAFALFFFVPQGSLVGWVFWSSSCWRASYWSSSTTRVLYALKLLLYGIQIEKQFIDKSEFIQASLFSESFLKRW